MNFEEYKDLVKDTRAVRRFRPGVKIEPKELEEVIDLVRTTSSALNKQPLRYIVVTNHYLVDMLSQTSKWASNLPDWDQKESERPSAYIIILNDTTVEGFAMLDCGIVLNSIMLSLKIKGYGACPLASIDKEFCKKSFQIPTNLEPLLGIAVGIQEEQIKIVDVKDDNTSYYKEGEVHCVPKRAFDDVLIGVYE